MKMRNGWLVRVADFWTDRRPLPSGLDGGRRVRECTPSPCLLCKHWHSTRMRTLFSKSSVKNSKTCNDKSYVARSELCVFYAAPQIMRTPLFRLEIHEVRFFWGGRGLASRAAAKWGLSSGWVLYGVFDDFLSSEFFLLLANLQKHGMTVPGVLIPAVPGTAKLSGLYVQSCSQDRYRKHGFDPADSTSQQ